jgi:hypothetical protein
MKKMFLLAFASVWMIACNENNPDSINKDTRTDSVIATEPPVTSVDAYAPREGDVTYREHKLMIMKNGEWVESDKDVTMNNGVVVHRSGKASKDNKDVDVEEGVVVDKNGNFFDKAGHAIDNAWESTKHGVKKAGNEIEKGAKKVKEKTKDALHDDDNDHDNK